MSHKHARILLWLFVIGLGLAAGAGLYETKTQMPRWVRSARANGLPSQVASSANIGMQFWLYTTAVPLTLLTLASFFAIRFVDPETRKWWLIAAWASLGSQILTFAYFIPTLLQLSGGRETNARAVAFQWAQVNWFRHVLSFSAWLAALQAFACFARLRRRRVSRSAVAAERASQVSEVELRA
jgi:hypothetical protein